MPYSPVLFCIRASKSFPVWCQSGRTKSLLVIGVFPSKTIPLVQYGCHIHPSIHRAHTGCKPPPWEYLRVKVWLRRLVKKNGYFTVRLAVRFDPPPPFTVSFLWFFFVFYWPFIMIICVLKRILHKKRLFSSNYYPTTISTIRSLQMIIGRAAAVRGGIWDSSSCMEIDLIHSCVKSLSEQM